MNSSLSINRSKVLLAALLTSLLAACGGGGGGDATTPASPPTNITSPTNTTPPAVTNTGNVTPTCTGDNQTITLVTTIAPVLRITEVAAKTNATGAEGGWFEVFNASSVAANLSDYKIQSTAYDTTAAALTTATFSLPGMNLPAGGYVVLASKALYFLPDGPQLKYVGTTSLYPSWNASGYIDLQRVADGSTEDFVRFGTNTTAPATSSAWKNNASAAPLPSGPATNPALSPYGKSMVRLASGNYADTDSAADWVQVNFSTPGGKNDIAPGTVDSDADGVPDSAKISCNTYSGLDLYAMGARPGKRDVFLEIHVMDQNPSATVADLGFIPRKEALQKVVESFAAKNIRLHIDAGSRFSTTFDPANFNLGGGNAAGTIPFKPCTDMPILPSDVVRPECSNFFTHKNSNFDVRRRVMFSYNLFANSQLTTGLGGSSGFAEIRGNDSMITMGGFGFSTTATASLTAEQNTLRYINMQAGTLMHEFGHNLSLRHGGFENVPNYKPNYVSVMNYMYQLVGIPGVQNDSNVGDRYQYYVQGLTANSTRNACLLINSRCSNDFIIDYSDGSSTNLDENALLGTSLIGRGIPVAGSFINWSGTATVASPAYAFNVNRDFTTATPSMPLLGVLRDYNDWANIQLPFVRTLSGFNSGASSDNTARRPASTDAPRRDPMNDAAEKEFVREDPPSPQLLRELQDNVLPGFRIRN
jgi:hypothetical protein